MKFFLHSLPVFAAIFLSACGTSRTAFAPDNGPPTVGMPAELSERERSFVPELDTALRNEGYLPVRHGSGDMQLEFEIAEGPINTDTKIELYEERRVIAKGNGRAAGAPLIGRAKVAQKSFMRAFEEFQSSLPGTSQGRSSSHESTREPAEESYVY